MGCDIHVFVEVREGGKWVGALSRLPERECPSCSGSRKDCWRCGGLGVVMEPYETRHYAVFSLLANVRNDDGQVTPISDPRGWPHDLSDEFTGWHDGYGGEHSESWFTARELQENRARIDGISQELGGFLDALLKLAPDPSDVRIVFDFDS